MRTQRRKGQAVSNEFTEEERKENGMSINRVFLDWKRRALPAAVDWLIERFSGAGQLDLENVTLALPGSRVGRRLLEILVEQAEKRKLRLCPPRIVTVGKLPELLYEAKRPFAGALVQQLAWVEALRGSEPGQVQAIVSAVPAADDLVAWLLLGEMLSRLHHELAADALNFPGVAQCGSQIDGFREAARWQALAGVQERYLDTLDRLGLWDLQTANLVAIRNGECRATAHIVLVGTADLNRSQRMMLDQVADHVTALVCAPEALAERFDEHGCLCPAAWLTQEIALADDQIEVADDPVGQAEAAVRIIMGLGGRYTTEQIAVGVADEEIVPYLRQRFEQCNLPGPVRRWHAHRTISPVPPAGLRGRLCRDAWVFGLRGFGAASLGQRLVGAQGDCGRLAEPNGPLPYQPHAPRSGRPMAGGW